MENLTLEFARTLRALNLSSAKLDADFSIANLAELDDAVQAALDAGHDCDTIGFAVHGARCLVRLEGGAQ